ncbi:hypothetical protein OXX69_005663 [Metschnikowia pulcherrima]
MLQKSLPQRPQKSVYVKALSKEAEVNKNLDIGDLPPKPIPKRTNISIFSSVEDPGSESGDDLLPPFADPLEDILAKSQAQIRQYQFQLPSERLKKESQAITISAEHSQNEAFAQKQQHLFKQIDLSPKKHTYEKYAQQGAFSNGLSHVPKLTAEEVDLRAETAQNKAFSGAHGPKTCISDAQPDESITDIANKSITDPLACHAENIMRMAMDSTMLNSFCNDTISSSFSNVLDESLAKTDGDSLTEENKPVSSLNFSAAAKIEISAQDLEMAVKNPFQLP